MIDLKQYKNKFVVYLMTFPNGKKYCGYSSDIKRRWKNEQEYRTQNVYHAIQKYGWDNIKKEVLYSFNNKEEALKKEFDIINELDLLNPNKGYNLVPGGNDPPHGLQYVSEEGYKKMQENGKRLAQELWGNPEKAAYARQRMSEVAKARAEAMTEIERKKVYGRHNIGNIPPNAKPIYQINILTDEIINEFASAGLAAEALGNRSYSANIRRTANGIGKSAYGFKWRWKNE